MNKKLTSTILLFAVFIGFLWWGISMLISSLSAPVKDGESIVYAILILGCAGYAMFSLLMLPRRNS
jgi:TRAP-type C4-dicarboxylate transport system permease small subunit